MIKEERFEINGKKFIKRYSDQNKYLLQVETGVKYGEAVDLEDAPYSYIETNDLMEFIEPR